MLDDNLQKPYSIVIVNERVNSLSITPENQIVLI